MYLPSLPGIDEASLSIGDSRQQRPRKKPSGGSSLHGWRDSRAEGREAATANGTASQQPLSLRRIASTSRRGHEGRQFTPLRMRKQQPKSSHLNISGKKGTFSGKKGKLSGKKGKLSGKKGTFSGKRVSRRIAQITTY